MKRKGALLLVVSLLLGEALIAGCCTTKCPSGGTATAGGTSGKTCSFSQMVKNINDWIAKNFW